MSLHLEIIITICLCLNFAGIGVVMGNANDEVKEKGDYITAKNTEDGVAKAIYKFLKI